jgi:GTPase SAR1 family protein
MLNPFCAPGLEDSGPLCPLNDPAHLSYYVAVDNTSEAFNKLQALLDQPSTKLAGGLSVLIHGEHGCGKTSLVHRCAHEIHHRLQEGCDGAVLVVDRSAEQLSGLSMVRKCAADVSTVIIRARSRENFLPEAALADFQKPSIVPDDQLHSELMAVMEAASARLKSIQRSVIIIPPKLELENEIGLYMSIFGKERLILIMETSEPAVAREAERRRGTGNQRIVRLDVGPLKLEDGRKYVHARVEAAKATAPEGSRIPDFDLDGIDKYMEKRLPRMSMSIRELELACTKVLKSAGDKQVIQYEDFADMWLSFGKGF